jgi:alpha-1,2-mannosyltransferase
MNALAALTSPRSARQWRGLAITAAVLQALVLAFFIAGTHGWIVPLKKPTTTDYASFYAAGTLANHGMPQAAYDQPKTPTDHTAHWRAEEAATAPGIDYQYFFNPPPYLLIMSPVARLPYMASLLLMQGATLGLWLWLGTRVAGGGAAATACLLAVPSLWWALAEGQNSFLSASLLAAGTLCLPARPLLAGVAFGALCYKPHLGLLIPVALLAAGQWRAIAAAALTVAAIIGATIGLYGLQTWAAFLATARLSVAGPIDSGRVLLAGRVDPTGALQVLGLAPPGARLVWAVCALAAACAVVWLWRRGSIETRSAGLIAAIQIVAPFELMYDLVIASLAAAWLVRAGRQRGFLPGEIAAMSLLLLMDLLSAHPVVAMFHIPFGAVCGPVLLALAVRRDLHETMGRPAPANTAAASRSV